MATRAHAIHVHPGHDLIAVFRTRAEAADAGLALVGAGAVDAEEVVLGADGDAAVVREAEMQTEFGRGPLSWRSLIARHGVLPSVVVLGAIGWTASFVIAALGALIHFGPDSYFERFVIIAVVVLAMGTMVSVLAIGAIATGAVDPPLASECGTCLHVHHANDTCCQMLLQMHPMRIDEVSSAGQPVPGVHMLDGRSVSPPGRHNLGWG
jgi:hypothetical protein